MTLTAGPRLLVRFAVLAVLAALALGGLVLALSSTGTPPVGAQDGSAPAKPTGVAATATHDSVALAWDDPRDTSITHYQIFRRDRGVHDAGEFVTIKENTGSAAASYTDDTVEPEKRYVYRVKAVNQHGASTWSNFVQADTPAAPTPDPTPTPTPTPEPEPTPDPADLAPSGLEVSLVENRVALSWDAPASDAASVTGYEVLRRRPKEGEKTLTTLVADTGNAETGYTDDSANEPGVRYTYRVRALRDGEQSRVSNYARIDLPDDYAQDTPEPEEEPSPEALAPSGLTAEAAEGGGVALSWIAPAEDAGSVTGYEVLRAQGSAELATLAADTGSTDTTYTDSGVTGDLDDYRYQVKALRGGNASQGSNVAGVLQSAHAGAIVPLADVTLVSNTGQPEGSTTAVVYEMAQGFQTGTTTGGYSLSEIVVGINTTGSGTARVTLYSSSTTDPATAEPSASLAVMTDVTYTSGTTDFVSFTAPANTTLSASTIYLVVLGEESGDGLRVRRTSPDEFGEDADAAAGWSITDRRLFKATSGANWSASNRIVMIQVKGSASTSTTSTAIWSATLTVGELTVDPDKYLGYARIGSGTGDLDPSTFSHDGDEITVFSLWYIVGGLLTFQISQELGGEGFLLRLGETLLPLGEPTDNPPKYEFSDHGLSWSDGDTVEVRLIPNQAATGAPVITGTAQVGETLTADASNIGDPDGIANPTFSYQWIANDGTVDTDISGATEPTYWPSADDVGQTIKVQVTFTDDNDYTETLESGYTTAVTGPAVTVVPSDWNLIPSGLSKGDQFRLIFLTAPLLDARACLQTPKVISINRFRQDRSITAKPQTRVGGRAQMVKSGRFCPRAIVCKHALN